MYDMVAKGNIDAAKKTGEGKMETLTTLLELGNIV
jgi:hypothetical protein